MCVCSAYSMCMCQCLFGCINIRLRSLDFVVVLQCNQVEVKRTVPKEDSQVKGVSKTRKIFIGGIPPSFTEGSITSICLY